MPRRTMAAAKGRLGPRRFRGVVLFSTREEHPFPVFRETALDRIPEIPIITIGKSDAAMILVSSGWDAEQLFRSWQSERIIRSKILISKLDLRVDAKFEMIETGSFTFAFEPRGISREAAAALARQARKRCSLT